MARSSTSARRSGTVLLLNNGLLRALLALCLAGSWQACDGRLLLGTPRLELLLDGEHSGGALDDASVQGDPFATCTGLKNHGTHSTVEIEVGTPPQKFDVVADTGSDSIIVASCLCAQTKSCFQGSKCFQGTNRSSTFMLEGMEVQPPAAPALEKKVPVVVLTFGSGEIEAVIGSDVVQVGNASAMMKNGLLLMIDQALRLTGPFEGILGLGLPRHEPLRLLENAQAPSAADVADPMAVGSVTGAGVKKQAAEMVYEPRGFLESAGVSRFSMCFNENAKDGVLRLGGPAGEQPLGSVGQVHWGLDFRGMTIGESSSALQMTFCDPANNKPGQATACGAIPDSGTTVLMGPTAHLMELFNGMCDAWPKCSQHFEKANATANVTKYQLLQVLLEDCERWLPQEGFSGLPTLSFHLAGAGGNEQTLKIAPETYVLEMWEDEIHYVKKYLMGVIPVLQAERTGKKRKVCAPAFGEQEYITDKNGPVWILGTPLFYEYQVGYDLHSTPPSVSFTEAPCGTCVDGSPATDDKAAAFLTRGRAAGGARRAKRRGPLRISGPLRVPDLDTDLPL